MYTKFLEKTIFPVSIVKVDNRRMAIEKEVAKKWIDGKIKHYHYTPSFDGLYKEILTLKAWLTNLKVPHVNYEFQVLIHVIDWQSGQYLPKQLNTILYL